MLREAINNIKEASIIKPLKAQITKTRMENHLKKNTKVSFKMVMSPQDGWFIVVKTQNELTEISKVLSLWGYTQDNQDVPFWVELEKNLKDIFN